MARTARRQHHERLGAVALLAVLLLVGAAQQPLSAAGKTRRVTAAPDVTVAPPAPAPAPTPPPADPSDTSGYWIVGVDGGIYAYGAAPFKGSTGATRLNKPMVGMAATPSGQGYWLVASDGGIFSYGDASFRGSTGAMQLNKPIVGMASTPSGRGYWLVASDGGIFAFGDAAFRGSTGALKLNKPIVGMAPTRSGQGYWLVASDGGIFAFGDATFAGSTGNLKLVRPITGMAAAPSGRGYWMTASDGGVFSFGDARFFGAARDRITTPEAGRGVIAIVPTRSGAGYWQVAASGKVFAFGDAAAGLGAPTATRSTIVGMAANPAAAGPAPAQAGVIRPLAVPSGPAPQMFVSAAKSTWGTSPSTEEKDKAGRALAVAEAGNRVFIGGEFAGLVPPVPNQKGYEAAPVTPRPYLAALDVVTGSPVNWDVHPDDAVLALEVSADRRTLYVGGRFRQIAGAPAVHLAAIDIETGTLAANFTVPAIDDPVKSIALFGNTLYIGGEFHSVDGVLRPQLAALDATTGALREGFVPPENDGGYYQGHTGSENNSSSHDGSIQDIGVTSDGRYVVAGGDFLDFGGQGGVIVLDANTGAAAPWQPEMDRPVFGLAMWPGDNRTFFAATGGSGGTLQAFRIDDAPAPPDDDSEDDHSGHRHRSRRSAGVSDGDPVPPLWVHRTDGDSTDVAATTERVYLVGHYDYVLGENTICHGSSCQGGKDGDVPNRHISVFEPHGGAQDIGFTGQLNTPQGPYAALVGARSLYVVGDFTECNGRPQPGFAQFPAL